MGTLGLVQLAFSLVCIVFGLSSKTRANRVLAALGVVWLTVAIVNLSRGSPAFWVVAVTSGVVLVAAMLWLVRLMRELRSASPDADHQPARHLFRGPR